MVDNAGLGPAYAYGSPSSSPVASPLVPLVPARSLALAQAGVRLLTYYLLITRRRRIAGEHCHTSNHTL